MAGEVSTLGIKIGYCAESTAGTRPTTGYAGKASGATLKISEYVTGASGFAADYDLADVTPLDETERHRFIKLLQSNDGKINLPCNVNPTSRDSWNAIVAEHQALTGGKSMWWEVSIPDDTKSYFFRGEPCEMNMPDIEVNQALQGSVQIIENGYGGWQTASTSSTA